MFHPFHHAARDPDKPAYVMARSGEAVSYRQLEARSNQGAQLLRSLGLKRGDAIALLLDNNARFFEICWAAQRAGLLYTAMSTRLSTQEAEYIIGDCGAKLLIVSASLAGQAAELLAKNPEVRHRYAVGGPLPGHDAWEAARAAQPARRIADESAGRDMLYSSGTTGRPKGVKTELLDEAIDAPGPLLNVAATLYGLGPDAVYLSPAPLYHAAPLRFNMTVMRFGGTAVIMEHFDAEEALALIERHGITHSQWVPTMFVRMLKLPPEVRARYRHATLRCAIHAAAVTARIARRRSSMKVPIGVSIGKSRSVPLDEGKLDGREVEIAVTERAIPMQMFTTMGLGEMEGEIKDFFEKMTPGKTRRRKAKKAARKPA